MGNITFTLGDWYKVTFHDDTTVNFKILGGEPIIVELTDGSKTDFNKLLSKRFKSVLSITI